MRGLDIIRIAAALLVMTVAASAAGKQVWDDCQAADPDRSIAGCNKIIQGHGESAKNRAIAYYNRGIAYSDKRDNDHAIADYTEAIRLDPKYVSAYNNRGNSYNRKGDYQRALQDYDRALAINPKHARSYNNRGEVYENMDDPDRALIAYNDAIRFDPDYARAYANRADVYFYQADFDRAIADSSEAIRLDSKRDGSFRRRGLAQFYKGEAAKALADLTQANEIDPKDGSTALWLDVVGQRNNIPSRLADATAKIDMTAWPGPVIRLVLGQSTVAAALAAAADRPGPNSRKDGICDVNFFAGVWAERKGEKDEAIRLLRVAANECRRASDVRATARATLKELGQAP